MKKIFRVLVKKSDGTVVRSRSFATKTLAETYEDEQLAHNPVASLFDFEIREESI